jgi:hypothetical protein
VRFFWGSLFHQFVDFAVRNVAIQESIVGTLLRQLVRSIKIKEVYETNAWKEIDFRT